MIDGAALNAHQWMSTPSTNGAAPDARVDGRYPPREAAMAQDLYDASSAPLMICVLGRFAVLKLGKPAASLSPHMRDLFHLLALVEHHRMPRESILEALWPGHDESLARQSLNSLVYSMRRLLGDALAGAAPVTHTDDGCYQLNQSAGIVVDVSCFDTLVDHSDQLRRAGQLAEATALRQQAIALYQGDLQLLGADLRSIVERERVRNRYLALLAQLANDYYAAADYQQCIASSQQLLETDPCREDAHRLLMRCYVRQGERATALRQYRACAEILRLAFDAEPEPATTALFEQIRFDPGRV